jgi:hypothetical protein
MSQPPESFSDHRDPWADQRRNARARWRRVFSSRLFWENVWDRLVEAYRSCDAGCFENGEAIGELSGAMYCAANIGVDGLPAPGFLAQQPLPLCENQIFIGCQSTYRQSVQKVEGCQAFTQGDYERTFLESISQDCHLD